MNTTFKLQIVAFVIILVFANLLQAQHGLDHFRNAEGVSVSEWQGREAAHASQKIKIKLNDNANRQESAASVEHLTVLRQPVFDKLGWGFFEVEDENRLFETIQSLTEHPLFGIVEPVFVGETGIVPNDTDYNLQWHLNNTGQSPTNGTTGADIAAEYAWDLTTGDSDVVIAPTRDSVCAFFT